MILSEVANNAEVLVIYPGRFQPFHKGHKAVFDHLNSKYDNVYIATSDKVDPPRSPFSFEEKKKMMELTGMDTTNVVLTKSPYVAMEITQNFDPENTVLLFAVSEKDMAEDPRFAFKPKKDGSPSYFQNAMDGNLQTMDKHGYILTVPTFNFDVLGQPMKSATEVRSSFASMDDKTKKQLIQDLFGNYSDEVFGLMSKITESSPHVQAGNHPHRVYGGLDGDIRDATEYLEELLAKVQSVPQGTKVRQRFMISFHKALNALKGQMAINLELRENYELNKVPNIITLKRKADSVNLVISETEIKVLETNKIIPAHSLVKLYERGYRKLEENNKMASQKLGVFAKGKSKVSLWEHDGTVVLVDQSSKRLQETKGTVKEAVDSMYDRGYVCESVDMTTMKNAAGAIMNVFFDTIKKTTTVRDQQGGSHTYEAPGDKVIAALQKKGFQSAGTGGGGGGLSLEPMDTGSQQGFR